MKNTLAAAEDGNIFQSDLYKETDFSTWLGKYFQFSAQTPKDFCSPSWNVAVKQRKESVKQ